MSVFRSTHDTVIPCLRWLLCRVCAAASSTALPARQIEELISAITALRVDQAALKDTVAEETRKAVRELQVRQGQTADTRSSRTRAALQAPVPLLTSAVLFTLLCCAVVPNLCGWDSGTIFLLALIVGHRRAGLVCIQQRHPTADVPAPGSWLPAGQSITVCYPAAEAAELTRLLREASNSSNEDDVMHPRFLELLCRSLPSPIADAISASVSRRSSTRGGVNLAIGLEAAAHLPHTTQHR